MRQQPRIAVVSLFAAVFCFASASATSAMTTGPPLGKIRSDSPARVINKVKEKHNNKYNNNSNRNGDKHSKNDGCDNGPSVPSTNGGTTTHSVPDGGLTIGLLGLAMAALLPLHKKLTKSA